MAALTNSLGGIVGWIVGVALLFIPALIAYLKKGSNVGMIFKCQIVMIVIDAVISLVVWVLPVLGILGSIWGIVDFVLWVYLICCASTDKYPSFFAVFGIR